MKKLNPQDIPALAIANLKVVGRYRVIIFVLFLVGLYGYVVFQINAAANVQPSATVTTTAQSSPHIDPGVVSQLQQLQDNSVSVKALFNQARTNPFQ